MLHKKIVIVNYGVGNIYNVEKALRKFTDNVIVSSNPRVVSSAHALVLPGVGSFPAGMKGLKDHDLVNEIRAFKGQIMGICLGAQLLMSVGYEFGKTKGLDIIKGEVVPFPKLKAKIPHIGWNNGVYFLHSFIMQPTYKENILETTTYGGHEFVSAIKSKNIVGYQYHPEKSDELGLKVIEEFVKL